MNDTSYAYVVCYKETTSPDGVLSVECGVCDDAYANERDAIRKVKELAAEKVRELEEDGEEPCVSGSNNGDYACVTYYEDTYEYYVYGITVLPKRSKRK